MGYPGLAGVDISEGMLSQARARGVYDDLRNRMLGGPLDYADASFAAVVSIGVFTMGHAPAEALDELVRITRPRSPDHDDRNWRLGGWRLLGRKLRRSSRLITGG